ncbi:unnamed protein product [Vitrella brassicaformis CCMP3155]|uniref:Uncharacterized protein n=1 Tax=Vitrella brassicaformis (strain CCMP3155) TaxID=1169540 RepID=A0A0G4F7X3_VITBC|nr:unnamed protein product [Vitrella brassicaformis CCMP3155]|eukprot:CEM08770.1 unnamed protein product [Vitrella brassicaformis CCMP3155]
MRQVQNQSADMLPPPKAQPGFPGPLPASSVDTTLHGGQQMSAAALFGPGPAGKAAQVSDKVEEMVEEEVPGESDETTAGSEEGGYAVFVDSKDKYLADSPHFFQKKFADGKNYWGVVAWKEPRSWKGKEQLMYQVIYADGDAEHMDKSELKRCSEGRSRSGARRRAPSMPPSLASVFKEIREAAIQLKKDGITEEDLLPLREATAEIEMKRRRTQAFMPARQHTTRSAARQGGSRKRGPSGTPKKQPRTNNTAKRQKPPPIPSDRRAQNRRRATDAASVPPRSDRGRARAAGRRRQWEKELPMSCDDVCVDACVDGGGGQGDGGLSVEVGVCGGRDDTCGNGGDSEKDGPGVVAVDLEDHSQDQTPASKADVLVAKGAPVLQAGAGLSMRAVNAFVEYHGGHPFSQSFWTVDALIGMAQRSDHHRTREMIAQPWCPPERRDWIVSRLFEVLLEHDRMINTPTHTNDADTDHTSPCKKRDPKAEPYIEMEVDT